jgi:hypothetical protein
MKKLFFLIATTGLMMSGCSKDELEESVTEGVSALATPVGGTTKSNSNGGRWNFHVWNEAYFNQGQGSLWAKRSGNPAQTPTVAARFTVKYEDSGVVVNGMFSRVGNSPNYRSASNLFSFTAADNFSLLSLSINWNAVDGTPQEESGSIFRYPPNRPVIQNPILAKPPRKICGSPISFDDTVFDDCLISATVADDPAQEVASLELRTDNATVQFGMTHFNKDLGLSRWTGGSWSGSGSTDISGALYLRGRNKYDADFITAETNAVIIAKYNVTQNSNGSVISVLSDEPEILGSRIGSRDGGATWIVEVAIADLGNWVNTVNYRFLETNGPAPLQQEVTLFLVRQEGNLKVYSNKVFFDGNPKGSDYQALISNLGTGTRTSSSQAGTKAELL